MKALSRCCADDVTNNKLRELYNQNEDCPDLEDCSDEPCGNGGICQGYGDAFTCNCSGTGFEGWRCQEDVNECLVGHRSLLPDKLCHANAVCQNIEGSYRCECKPGFRDNGTACVTVSSNPGSVVSSSSGPAGTGLIVGSLLGGMALVCGLGLILFRRRRVKRQVFVTPQGEDSPTVYNFAQIDVRVNGLYSLPPLRSKA